MVADCGVQPVGWGGADWAECVLPIGPQFPAGFRRGFSFLVLPGDDLSKPPRRFTTELRRWPVAGWNFRAVVRRMSADLGAGEDASVSNTIARRWRFGAASVQATAFPLHLNRDVGPNQRHVSDPGSATECRLTVEPQWCPPLTDGQYRALSGYMPFKDQPVEGLWDAHPLNDWPADLGPARVGVGLDTHGALLVAVAAGGKCRLIPRDLLAMVRHDGLSHAKGPACSTLTIEFRRAGEAGLRPGSLHLGSVDGSEDALLPQAQRLATLLGLPLETSLWPNC